MVTTEPITIPDNPHARRLYDFIVASAWPEGRTIDGAECPAGLCQIVTKRLSQAIGISRPSIDHWLEKLESAGVIARPDESVTKVLSMHFKPKNAKWVILLPRVVYFKPTPKKSAGADDGASTLLAEQSRTLAVVSTLSNSYLLAVYNLLRVLGGKPSADSLACFLSLSLEHSLSLVNALSSYQSKFGSSLSDVQTAKGGSNLSNVQTAKGGSNLSDVQIAKGGSNLSDVQIAKGGSSLSDVPTADDDLDLLIALGIEKGTTLSSVPTAGEYNAEGGSNTVLSNPHLDPLTTLDHAKAYIGNWVRRFNQERDETELSERKHARQPLPIPTLDQVKRYGWQKQYPPKSVANFFRHFEELGWKSTKGNRIRNWQGRLDAWVAADKKNQAQDGAADDLVRDFTKPSSNQAEAARALAAGQISQFEYEMLTGQAQRPPF